MSSFGPIHKLVVRKVGDPYGPFSTDEFEDCEIKHAPECKWSDSLDGFACGVGEYERERSIRWCLKYTGTPITEPGEYNIRAWAETIRGFDYTEYDGGVCIEPEHAEDDSA